MSLTAVIGLIYGLRRINMKGANSARFNSPNISGK